MIRKTKNILICLIVLLLVGCNLSFNLEDMPEAIVILYDESTSTVTMQNLNVKNTEYSVIRYTLDGSDPGISSPVYTEPVHVDPGTTVSARLCVIFPDYVEYEISRIVAGSAEYASASYVLYQDTENSFICRFKQVDGTEIYYTTDGSDPSIESDSRIRYASAFSSSIDGKVRFVTVHDGNISDVYYIPAVPQVSYGSGETGAVLKLESSDGSELLYTLDGTDPMTEGILYENPVPVVDGTFIRAVARSNGNYSIPVSRTYHGNILDAPAIEVESALDESTVSVSGKFGYTFRYTVDGSNPLENGTVYTEPFKAANGSSVKVVAEYGDKVSAVVTEVVPVSVPSYHLESDGEGGFNLVLSGDTSAEFEVSYAPYEESIAWTAPMHVDIPFHLRAIAKIGEAVSAPVGVHVLVAPSFTAPVFSFSAERVLALSNDGLGRILYTTDGTVPAADGATTSVYDGNGLSLSSGTVVKAASEMDGNLSDVVEFKVPVETPQLKIRENENKVLVAEITTTVTTPEIHYVFGNRPAVNITSDDTRYDGAILCDGSGYLSAAAYENGLWSDIVSIYFDSNMTVPLPVIDVTEASDITSRLEITGFEEGDVVYYTLDGSDPIDAAIRYVYEAPVVIDNGAKVTSRIYRDGFYSNPESVEVENPLVLDVFARTGSSYLEVVASGKVYYLISYNETATRDEISRIYKAPTYVENGKYLHVYAVSRYGLPTEVKTVYLSDAVIPDSPSISRDGLSIQISNYNGFGDIYYTVDGTDPICLDEIGRAEPSETALLYEGSFSVANGQTVKASVLQNGHASEVVEVTTPMIKPTLELVVHRDGCRVGITGEGTIYYLVNSYMSASTDSITNEYTDRIDVEFSKYVHAYAVSDFGVASEVVTEKVRDSVVIPEFYSHDFTSRRNRSVVTFSSPYGSYVYYTTDGSDPCYMDETGHIKKSDSAVRYDSYDTCYAENGNTVKAVVVSDNIASDVLSFDIPVYKPEITREGTLYTIESDTGSTTYYRIGETGEYTEYVEPFEYSGKESVTAYSKLNESISESSTFREPTAPVMNCAYDSRSNANKLTITSNEGSSIYYKLSTSYDYQLYENPVTISSSCTVEAYARNSGITSETVSYSIDIPSVPGLTVGYDSNYERYTVRFNTLSYYDKVYVSYDNYSFSESTGYSSSRYIYYYCLRNGLRSEVKYVDLGDHFKPVISRDESSSTNKFKITAPSGAGVVYYKTSNMYDYSRYTGPVSVSSSCTVDAYINIQGEIFRADTYSITIPRAPSISWSGGTGYITSYDGGTIYYYIGNSNRPAYDSYGWNRYYDSFYESSYSRYVYAYVDLDGWKSPMVYK